MRALNFVSALNVFKTFNVYTALVHLCINNKNNHYHNGGGLFTAFPKKMALHLLIKYIIAYLTDFWKTNVTKFEVIWLKRRQKAVFLSPRTAPKSQQRRKRKGEKERATEEIRKGGEEKKAMVPLLVFIMSYFGNSFWPKKTVGRKRSIWR